MLFAKRMFLRILQEVLHFFGFQMVTKQDLADMRKKLDRWRQRAVHPADLYVAYEFVNMFPSGFLAEYLPQSKSQLHQDLFVLAQLDFQREGFFVEFGATDGVALSNSYLLEKQFGWTGILAEPAKRWHEALRQNRACKIDTRCVWSTSGTRILFNESEVGELSTIDSFRNSDGTNTELEDGNRYKVETVSLLDLLDSWSAPFQIDYLSIDTEGSEPEILEAFDFCKYSFRVISVEHNFTENRERMRVLLEANGYLRVHEWLSGWDDWYVPGRS